MNLEILSFREALNYIPKDKSYAIRISNGITHFPIRDLIKSNNWININIYSFDDVWTKEWKEYSWLDFNSPDFERVAGKSWEELSREYPRMTEKSFLSYLENGCSFGRITLFDKNKAIKILEDYDNIKKDVDSVMIHCNRGENRSPAVGIAMNEIYGWGIEGLKEKFPNYRKFVYDILKRVG